MFMKLNNFLAKRGGMRALMGRSEYVDENTMGYGNNRAISPRKLAFNELKISQLQGGGREPDEEKRC